MIGAKEISQIVAMYRTHGWTLRRALVSDGLARILGGASEPLFEGVEVRRSDLDALWFARPPKDGEETWELRRLTSTPFALNEFFDEDDEPEIREEAMAEAEARLRDAKV